MKIRGGWGYGFCLAAGAVFYLAAGLVSGSESGLTENEDGCYLKRNPCGQGDAEYHFFVEGLENEPVPVELAVGEQKLTGEQGANVLTPAVELLCERIRGENLSLAEVRTDLNLPGELPEYGFTLSWESERPELLSSMGLVHGETADEAGEAVYLKVRMTNGIFDETVEIPVVVFPGKENKMQQFIKILAEAAETGREEDRVKLPIEFEGRKLSYRETGQAGNEILLFLGAAAAGCLFLKEKNDIEKEKKRRKDSLLLDYSDILSRFAVLTGAGFTIRHAWKKIVLDYERKWTEKSGIGSRENGKRAALRGRRKRERPVYDEMRMTLNQMETGIPELQAYGNFGRRCGLRCYLRFVSLLENNLNTGGKNLRKLLEAEVENAFEQRKDLARRMGEEASAKLLVPLFLMLGVVMVMIVAPAFLTLG